MIRIMKDMLLLCIERMFGLTIGCRILEIIFSKLAIMILVRSTRKVGDHLKRKRGLTLCYSCKRPGHLVKECPNRRPSCVCCKAMDNEVLDFPTMIAKLERMNMRQENPNEGQETKTMVEPRK
jgi:hypothetical protein